MQRLGYDRLIVGLVALAVVIGVSWIVLEYLVPSLQCHYRDRWERNYV